MSTILKALRRLEQDRVAEVERPLEAAVVEPAPAGQAARGGARWLAGVLAAAALGAGTVLLLQREGGAPTPFVSAGPAHSAPPIATPPPVSAPPPVIAAPARPVLAPVPAPVEAAPPALAPSAMAAQSPSAAEAAAPGLSEEPLDLAEQSPPPPVAAPPSPVAKLPAVVSPTVAKLPAVAPPVQATPLRVARLEPRAAAPKAALPGRAAPGSEAGAVVAQSVTHGAGDESEGEDVRTIEPQHKRTARVAPTAALGISVLRTIWHPKPERRTALLDAPGDESPREFREGDRVGSLLLLRIEPSGVVFERDGVELREKIVARP